MAPHKRSRRAVDDNDIEEEEHVRDQGANHKRARTSLDNGDHPHPGRDGSPGSSSESEGENDSDRDDYNAPPQTQYEIMRDNGFRHLEFIEQDDYQATQKLKRKPTQIANNMVADGGIIESITCYNFMCHERLHVELGPLINFIVGENGSGKSAVLTALTLCLGGKASDTNRGGSLRSFVKEGRDQGSLVVKIKNAGTDAYQPDLYGDSIIIERHFSKTGSSGFKIKTSAGRIVSTKKQEVDEISEWYALQIGNPLTVLSQDNARQFLNAASPAQKYKYFVEGVQLEQLDNDYKLAQDMLQNTETLEDDLKERVARLKKQADDAKRLSDTAHKNASMREKRRHYRNQLIWSQVVMQERMAQESATEVARRTAAIEQHEQECNAKASVLTSVEAKLQAAKDACKELQEEQSTLDERVMEATADRDRVRKEVSDLQIDERDAHGRLRNIGTHIRETEVSIGEEEARLEAASGSARAEKDAELAETKAQERATEAELEQATQAAPGLETSVTQANESLRKYRSAKELKRKEIITSEKHLREIKGSTGSPLDGFDSDIKNLVRAIERDGSFQHKPIGPIGAHVRLLKPEWSGVLEKTFGEALNAFVVRSKQDQSRLADLMRQNRMQRTPQIYVAYCTQIDTSGQEPDAKFDTILRVLEFDNDLIRTQLVINNQIEKIVLIPDRNEAQRIMVVQGQPPQNVAACLCFHDGSNKRGHGLRITNRGGSASVAPVTPNHQRARMRTDSAEQAKIQETALAQLGADLREINAEERQALAAVQRAETAASNQRNAVKRLRGELRRLGADIERIEEELDRFEGADDRLNSLRQQLQTYRVEQDNAGAQYGHLKVTMQELQEKARGFQAKLDEVKLEKQDFGQRMHKAESKIKAKESLKSITISAKNDAHEKLDIARAERQRMIEKQEETQALVEEFTARATELSPRVHIPDEETYESITKKYEALNAQLEERRKRLGASDEEIFKRFSEARDRHLEVEQQAEDSRKTIVALKRAIHSRLQLWRSFQRQISARIRIQFNYLLSERGFRGKIVLDHKFRKVDIQIEPDETKKSAAGRNTKTLSGGEKSFSSICMLLSIWEAIGSPIRCLDEFDVFMDNVNRAISTNMLVDAARRSVSRQYILITPNAIEGRVRLEKDVKIIRLTDPRQRTLT